MEENETNPPSAAEPELSIEKWVYGGDGLGRLEGRAVLVPFTLPGETVRVSILRKKPGLLEAALREVLAPAPERVKPDCPVFGRCGGCQYQHAAYEAQIAWKRDVLREALRRIGKLEPPEDIGIIPSPPWGYRNRTQLHLADGRIGYLEAGTHRLCPVDRCPISSPRINEALRALRGLMGSARFPRFVRSLELFTNESQVQLNVLRTQRPVARSFFEWCAEQIPGAAEGSLEYPAAGFLYRVSHQSFFQVNRYLIDPLIECALGEAQGETALDLYAGVGLFSLPLSRRFHSVTAVESSAAAARDLEFNTARAGLELTAVRSPVERFLGNLEIGPDFALADPPRSGLGKVVVRELLRLAPRCVVIVSCDPSTLARDVAPLIAGGYRIDRLTLVDLFPQTYHIETVVRLRSG